jgi:hypothetical protein
MKPPSIIEENYMTRFTSLFSLWLVAVGVVGSACSLTVESERVQCKSKEDCAARGPSFSDWVCKKSICEPNPTWACLTQPNEPSTSVTVTVEFKTVDLLKLTPIPGVRLTLCAKMDANCQQPIGSTYQSDQAGEIKVEMPKGFDGYFQTEGDGLYPMLFFPPNTRQQHAPGTLPMVAASFVGTMFSGVGGPISADRTVIMTTALDCQANPASGLILSADPVDDRTVGYVIQGGLPNRTASATDSSGTGGFVNIKPGNAVITSTMASTNEKIGTVAVQTRTGSITMGLVMPNGS